MLPTPLALGTPVYARHVCVCVGGGGALLKMGCFIDSPATLAPHETVETQNNQQALLHILTALLGVPRQRVWETCPAIASAADHLQ